MVEEAEEFDSFLRWSFIASQLAALAVLAVYARRGARFIRESAAGRIGTGMLLGMLGLAFVWLSQLPFQLLELWWLRRHDLWKAGYLDWFVERWALLAGEFLFICLWLLITMALAARFRRTWWLPAVPVFVGLALLFAFLYPYLVVDQHAASPELKRDVVRFAERQDTEPVKVVVEETSEFTTAPNAYATGLGPSRRIFLWDTLLDGRFDDDQVGVVLAHELAHHSRGHIWKGIAWLALLLLPLLGGVAWLTRQAWWSLPAEGGAARPAGAGCGKSPAAARSTTPSRGSGRPRRTGSRSRRRATRPRRGRSSGASLERRSRIRRRRAGHTRRWPRTRRSRGGSRWRPRGSAVTAS